MTSTVRAASRLLRLVSPKFPGKTRLAKTLVHSHLRAENVEIPADYNCTFLVPSLREPVAFHLITDGVYEPETLKLMLNNLGLGSTYVDIGANIGTFALPAARKVGPTGRVIAVDASPRVFGYLRHNVEFNGLKNVSLRHCAVADRVCASVAFYEAPIARFGMGALAPQFDASPVLVATTTLDALLVDQGVTRVDVLKVDVEGFEADVFRGAEGLLSGPAPPLVIFEFCDWAESRVPDGRTGDAQRVILSQGYRIWRLSDFPRGRILTEPLERGSEMLVAIRS